MNLHEYQAKRLFADYGLPVSAGIVVKSADEMADAAAKIGGKQWVVKAQIHAGGRGKAGGVSVVDNVEALRAFADKWLGQRMVTYQTGPAGQPVERLLVEACTDIADELYLGAVLDRGSRRVVFMASAEGGVDIEKVAAETPEKLLYATLDPLTGAQPYQARQLAYDLGLDRSQLRQFTDIFLRLAKIFVERDLSLLEINPLVITTAGNLHCLDAKVDVDANALYRQQEIADLRDPSQEDAREALAAKWQLNYVALDGNIGCMVNGAGLAMGTMDIIQLEGGAPANFLDIGGGADSERVGEAFKIILSDESVQAVLINIFGGIVRCDLVAEGIVNAVREVGVQVPVIVRLEGNNAAVGAEILASSGVGVMPAAGLREAAVMAVEAASRSAGS